MRHRHSITGAHPLRTAVAACLVLCAAAIAPAVAGADVLENWGPAGEVSADVRGVAVDANGDVYLADRGRNRVTVFTRSGVALRDWEGSPAFSGLSGVAVAPDGDIYTSETGKVRRFSPSGTQKLTLGAFGDDAGELQDTAGVALGGDGTVYVSDRGNRRVQAYGPDGSSRGVVVADSDAPGGADLSAPGGIAVDGATLLVAETEADVIHRIALPGGAELDAIPAPGVNGVAVAPDRTIHATDAEGHVVRSFAPDGTPAGTLQGNGLGLNQPFAVATDCRGAVYAADRSALRITVFGPAGLAAPPCVPPPPPPPPPAEPTPTPPPPPQLQVAGVQEASPEPGLGTSGVASVVSGRVFYRLPDAQRYRQLLETSKLPVGTEIDVRDGVVRIRFATAPEDRATYGPVQEGEFWGGEFRFFQAASGSLVDVILSGAQPECGLAAGARSAQRRKRGKRFVWGKAKGRFRTSGNHGAATVRGTAWYTEDRCDGTFFRTREGLVDVADFGRKKTVPVRAGARYLARAPCASRRSFDIRLLVPVGTTVASARVVVNGRRVRVRDGDPPRVRVNLRGRPKQRVRVRIRVLTGAGAVLTGVREYRTCTVKRDGRRPPRL